MRRAERKLLKKPTAEGAKNRSNSAKTAGEKALPLCRICKTPLQSRPESTLKAPHSRICNVQMPYVLRETKRPRLYGKVALPKRAFVPLPCCRKKHPHAYPAKTANYTLARTKSLRAKSLGAALFLPTAKNAPAKTGTLQRVFTFTARCNFA